MKASNSKAAPQEPVGIVISGTPRTEQPPVFSAYIWAPAPASSEEDSTAA